MKKKLFFLLLPLIAAAWLLALPSGCKKDEGYVGPGLLRGKVTEYGTGLPVPGVRLTASECCEVDTPYHFFTDAAGEYRFELPAEFTNLGYLYLDKEGYDFNGGIPAIAAYLDSHRDFVMDPLGYLKVRLLNVPGGYDGILVVAPYQGGYSHFGGFQHPDTTILYEVLGNRKAEIRWKFFENTPPTLSDSIYLIGHDTVFYQINY